MRNAIAPRTISAALEPPDHASQALGFISGLVAGTPPVTWVFTGDSITHGALYTEGWRSFPEHFGERIRWELRRCQDVVINTGVFGERSAGLLANLEARALRFLPDVVLVMIGMNDAVVGPDGRQAFRENLLEIVGRIREAGSIPVVQTPNTVYRPNSLFWVDLPAYVEIIREVAHETQSPLVDHWRHWEKAKADPAQLLAWLQDQSIHPNGYGHRELARHLCRTLGIYDPASLMCRLEVP
jgi:lysophospholipase L1-like esterase